MRRVKDGEWGVFLFYFKNLCTKILFFEIILKNFWIEIFLGVLIACKIQIEFHRVEKWKWKLNGFEERAERVNVCRSGSIETACSLLFTQMAALKEEKIKLIAPRHFRIFQNCLLPFSILLIFPLVFHQTIFNFSYALDVWME